MGGNEKDPLGLLEETAPQSSNHDPLGILQDTGNEPVKSEIPEVTESPTGEITPVISPARQKLLDTLKPKVQEILSTEFFSDPVNKEKFYETLSDRYTPDEIAQLKGVSTVAETPGKLTTTITGQDQASVNVAQGEDFKPEESTTLKVLEIPASPSQTMIDGIKGGWQQLKNTGNVYDTEGEIAATANATAGVVRMVFGAFNVVPSVAAFTMGITSSHQVFPKTTEAIMAPASSIAKAINKSPTSEGGKAGIELLDFLSMGLLMHSTIKGGGKVKEIITEPGKVTAEGIAEGLKEFGELSPEQQQATAEAYAKKTVEENKFESNLTPDEKQVFTFSKQAEELMQEISNENTPPEIKAIYENKLAEVTNGFAEASDKATTQQVLSAAESAQRSVLETKKATLESHEPTTPTGIAVKEEALKNIDETINQINKNQNGKSSSEQNKKEGSEEIKTDAEKEVLAKSDLATQAEGEKASSPVSETPEEIAGIEEAKKISDEKGFEHPAHLINKINKDLKLDEENKFSNVQEIPENIINQTVKNKEAAEGKKAIVNRVYEGKTPDEVKASVEKHGLNYEIESHAEAERLAANYVADIGIDNALESVRKNEVKGGASSFVWATAIDALHKEYLLEPDVAKKAEILEKETALINEFGKEAKTSGQFISALQSVYQTSDLGYKLGGMLNRAKDVNMGEPVPEILKNKLTELSVKLDEVNTRLAELEKKQKEEPVVVIQEPKTKRTSSLSPEKETRKNELRKKYAGILNDITNVPRLIAEKEFREYAGLVLEEMGGDFKNFSREMINSVGKGIREHLPNLYKELGGKENPQIENIQKNLKKQIDEYERRLREKDFSKKNKNEPPTLDEETFNMQVERNKLKDEVDLEIEKLRLKNRPTAQKVSDSFVDVFNLPKSLTASADMSAPLRQGAVLGVSHPMIAGRSAKEMIRQAFSEKKAIDWLARLKASPEYAAMQKADLYLAEPTAKLTAKEEIFISNIAHRIPVWGRVVKGSERAYTGYLNKLRADVFSQFHDALLREGFKGELLDKELKSFAGFVNNASGRGSFGTFENSAPLLNSVFFSPRYAISRFNLINPVSYFKMSPMARKEALRSVGIYIGMASMVLYIAKAGGAEVELDPRSADFAKIKVGNTRYDILSGFQQWVRLIAQLRSGEKKSISGRVKSLGEGYKADTRLDVMGKFGRTKLSPVVGVAADLLSGGKNKKGDFVGRDIIGNEVTLPEEALKLVLPLWQSDLSDIAKEDGVGGAAAAGTASFFGIGVQNYDYKPDK